MSEAGKPLSASERAGRSNKQLIQNVNRSIRTDFGGRPSVLDYIAEQFDEVLTGHVSNSGTRMAVAKLLAPTALTLIKDQIEGVRKRTSHDREELLRRFTEEAADMVVTNIPKSDNELNSTELQIKELREDFNQKLSEVRVAHLTSLRQLNKIQKIMNWAEGEGWFNTDFVKNLNESLLNWGTLTVKQESALDNIIARCVNGDGRGDFSGDDWSVRHGY